MNMFSLQPAGWLPALPLFLLTIPVCVEGQTLETPRTRAEAIEDERADKVAELWPERQSPMVDRVERSGRARVQGGSGFRAGRQRCPVAVGRHAIGSGDSPAGSATVGRISGRSVSGYRATARGTFQRAYMFDFRSRLSGTSNASGRRCGGTRSSRARRTSITTDSGTRRPKRTTRAFSTTTSPPTSAPRGSLFDASVSGLTGGYHGAHTGAGSATSFRRSSEVFPPKELPGFGENTQYTRIGAFAVRRFPRFADGSTERRIATACGTGSTWDVDRKTFAFRQSEFEFQQYLPYFNRGRVVAVRAAAVLSFPKSDNQVPVYLQPIARRQRRPARLRSIPLPRYPLRLSGRRTPLARARAFSTWRRSSTPARSCRSNATSTPTRFTTAAASGSVSVLGSAVVTRIDFAGSSEGLQVDLDVQRHLSAASGSAMTSPHGACCGS